MGEQSYSDLASNVLPRFATIPTWCVLSGQSRTRAYAALAAGHLRAVKDGKRTLIDVQHGLAWLRSLPSATFRPPRHAA
jgi:hypothetical protein